MPGEKGHGPVDRSSEGRVESEPLPLCPCPAARPCILIRCRSSFFTFHVKGDPRPAYLAHWLYFKARAIPSLLVSSPSPTAFVPSRPFPLFLAPLHTTTALVKMSAQTANGKEVQLYSRDDVAKVSSALSPLTMQSAFAMCITSAEHCHTFGYITAQQAGRCLDRH